VRLLLYLFLLIILANCDGKPTTSTQLFDGKTFNGWEGDTLATWKIIEGVIVGGSLTEVVPHNDFLCTIKSYENFILNLNYKIEGNEGFINGGVQFRSQRLTDPSYEMIGYQADIGNKFDGALYDESRRKSFLAGLDTLESSIIAKHGNWNHMEIVARDRRVRIFLNGQQTVDYVEADSTIFQIGKIGLQVHGDGKARVSFKNITIKDIP
jgi:hypothetical protein